MPFDGMGGSSIPAAARAQMLEMFDAAGPVQVAELKRRLEANEVRGGSPLACPVAVLSGQRRDTADIGRYVRFSRRFGEENGYGPAEGWFIGHISPAPLPSYKEGQRALLALIAEWQAPPAEQPAPPSLGQRLRAAVAPLVAGAQAEDLAIAAVLMLAIVVPYVV
ncbi:MAG TPA: hypothetical protein VEI97_10215 [bacterium]|nr:hypothetical protein [bacterium]